MRHEAVRGSCRLPQYNFREPIIGSARPPADLVCVRECTSSLTSQGHSQVSGKQVLRISRHSSGLILLSSEGQQLHYFHLFKLMPSGDQPNFPETEVQNCLGCIWPDIIFTATKCNKETEMKIRSLINDVTALTM